MGKAIDIDLIAGADVLSVTVRIPQVELERVLKGRLAPLERAARRPNTMPSGVRSKIWHDAPVRRLLDRLLRQPLTLAEIRRRLATRFGQDRAPSRSAIARYVRPRRLSLGWPLSRPK